MSKRKRVQVNFWVPPDVKEAWERAAEASGLTLAEWCRLRCNGSVLEAIPPSKVA